MGAPDNRAGRHSMADDPQNVVFLLGQASVLLEPKAARRRFRVDTATLSPAGQRRVALRFEGQHGAVTLEMARAGFWQMAAAFIDASTALDFGKATGAAKPRRRKPR